MTSNDPSVSEENRDASREPFFWLFVILAVIVAVVAATGLSAGDDTEASFLPADTQDAVNESVAPVALPTPEPTPIPPETPAVVELVYSGSAIVVGGVVPAPAVAEALVAASGQLVGADAVTSNIEVDTAASLVGALLILTGEVDDETQRGLVLAAFSDLGLDLDDRLILAGSDQSIVDVLTNNPDLSEVTGFMDAAGLLEQLGAEGEPLTLFAPTNAAFRNLDQAVFDALSDVEELTGVLQYHMVAGRIAVSDLDGITALTSLQLESISVEHRDDVVVVGGAIVSVVDIDATNGVVHIVDAVLLPGTLRTEVALNQLVTLDPVLFSRGSAEILDESLLILDEAAQVLRDNPLGRVEIQGHTDSDGPAQANLELSQRRAEAVVDYLVDKGVGAVRLTAVGLGETQLKVDPEESDDDRLTNRRIEFRVT